MPSPSLSITLSLTPRTRLSRETCALFSLACPGLGNLILTTHTRTSGENIGDSGLIQAFRAWKAQYNDSFKAGNEFLLPGLNFTRCDSFPSSIDLQLLTQEFGQGTTLLHQFCAYLGSDDETGCGGATNKNRPPFAVYLSS
jgi:hypothetical protein